MSIVTTKLNGQIWIDKNSPYSLKYRYNNTNYTVLTYQPLDANSISYDDSPTGSILAFKPVGEESEITVQKAHFPEDINNVIGLSMQKDGRVYLVDSGELTVPIDAFEEDLQSNVKIGSPVYWYLDTYREDVTTLTSGKLTLKTPNYYGTAVSEEGTELTTNIGYNNLPQVGTIKEVLENSIILNVNFSNFDTSLEWFWPLKVDENHTETHNISCGQIGAGTHTIKMCHGLFTDANKFRAQNTVSIIDNDKEYKASADFINTGITASNVTNTKMTIHSIDSFRYSVNGIVSYNLDRS